MLGCFKNIDIVKYAFSEISGMKNKSFMIWMYVSFSETHFDFSWGFSSDSLFDAGSREVSFPKDSLASPKKSFTLSRTVLSWSCVGS